MSTFPASEPFPARWSHIPRHHDINLPFLPPYNTSCALQEGQFCNPPLSEKNSNMVNFCPLSHPSKEHRGFDTDFERCGHTSTDYENTCVAPQGDDMTQLDIDLEKGNTTIQKGVSASRDLWIGLGQNAFEGSLQAPEVASRYCDFLTKPVECGEEQHIGLLIMNNFGGCTQLLAEASTDVTEQGNETFDNAHGNTIAPKQKYASIDKKEMRARRNRESARRSRLKSKQHFQRMEQTFVLLRRENRALLVLVENRLPNYIARFPHLAGKLVSLFEMRQ